MLYSFVISLRGVLVISGYRIHIEIMETCCSEADEESIQQLNSTTGDIANSINLSRYGVVSSKRYGNVTVRWRASESNALANRMHDIGV